MYPELWYSHQLIKSVTIEIPKTLILTIFWVFFRVLFFIFYNILSSAFQRTCPLMASEIFLFNLDFSEIGVFYPKFSNFQFSFFTSFVAASDQRQMRQKQFRKTSVFILLTFENDSGCHSNETFYYPSHKEGFESLKVYYPHGILFKILCRMRDRRALGNHTANYSLSLQILGGKWFKYFVHILNTT